MERLAHFGLLTNKAIFAHGVYLSDHDIQLINDHDSWLVHNARSNMNNNVGYNYKIPQYKNFALGTDGMGSDMWEELKFAYFKHKDTAGPLWPDSFLRYLYNGNTILERYFGAKFGQIAPGYKADLIILDYNSPTPLVADNIGGHIAFGLDSRDVKTVIVNGQIATQYVDQDGSPSMDMKYNPNGSVLAIEGITSPDGRVFGKMGHSERSGEYLYKNVTGDKYQPIFEGGVDYFKI